MEILTDDDDWQGGLLTGPTLELKIVSDASTSGLVEGYGATFGGIDHGLDTIAPGAFAESLQQHHAANTAPAMLWSHRMSEPVGKWLAMGEDARGLRVRGQLNMDTTRGREAHAHIRAGDATGLSVGYQIAPRGLQSGKDGSRLLSKLHLHEVSVVPVPMDPRARITASKSVVEIKSVADLRTLLRDAGLSRGAAEKIAAPGWAALSGEPDFPQPDPAAVQMVKALDASASDIRALQELFR